MVLFLFTVLPSSLTMGIVVLMSFSMLMFLALTILLIKFSKDRLHHDNHAGDQRWCECDHKDAEVRNTALNSTSAHQHDPHKVPLL